MTTDDERTAMIRGLCRMANVSTEQAEDYIASEMSLEEIRRELVSQTAHRDMAIGEIGVLSDADARLTPAEREEKFSRYRSEERERRATSWQITEDLVALVAEQCSRGVEPGATLDAATAWLRERATNSKLRAYVLSWLRQIVETPQPDVDGATQRVLERVLEWLELVRNVADQEES